MGETVISGKRRNIRRSVEKLTQQSFVLARIYKLIKEDGININGDPFTEYDELRKDKDFAKKCISIYPEAYEFISPNLRVDRDVLVTLAKSPLYYNIDNINDFDTSTISPLFFILKEDNRRRFYTKTKRDGSKEEKIGEGLPFVVEEDGKFKINDLELLLLALKAELDSYEYSKEIEKEYGQIFQYKGIYILNALKQGEKVDFSKYMLLHTLQFASKDILENEDCKKQIEEIIQQWAIKEIKKAKKEKRISEKDSSDLDWLIP